MTTLSAELDKVEDEQLTGRYYHKQTFWGLLLMVEYKYSMHTYTGSLPMIAWRQGKVEDLKTLGLVTQ